MIIEDYVNIINETSVYPQEVKRFGVAYAYLGLIGEFNELREVLEDHEASQEDIEKECGDNFWYITALCFEAGIDAEEILSTEYEVPYDAEPSLEQLAESIKKFYRDGKPLNANLFQDVLSDYVAILKRFVIRDRGMNFGVILKKNYDKLIRRRETNTLKGDGSNREQFV